jgi:holo-[acyl-carrier protein] synthase
MFQGIGTDIIAIERIESAIERQGEAFIKRLFTVKEREYCMKMAHPSTHYAGRFAAKEAVVKALGCGFGSLIGFHDIEILNNLKGAPEVTLSERAQEEFKGVQILLSISHCKSHATAVALAQT